MSNRFLISVAAAALIAGTGVANAQSPGRDAGSAGSAAQSAPSSERGGASSGTMQRDSGHDSGDKSDMKPTQSEQKSTGAEKNQRAEDQKKGGNDMKAEGKEDRGGMKSEHKAEQKSEKGQTTGQGTTQRDQSTTQRDQVTRARPRVAIASRDQKAQGSQDRMQTQTQQGGARPKHDYYGPSRRGREALDRAAYPDHQCDQGAACFAGDERQLLDLGRHPRPARCDLPRVTVASRDDLSRMAQL